MSTIKEEMLGKEILAKTPNPETRSKSETKSKSKVEGYNFSSPSKKVIMFGIGTGVLFGLTVYKLLAQQSHNGSRMSTRSKSLDLEYVPMPRSER